MAVLVGPMALEVFRALARSFMCVESYCFVCVSFMAHTKKILGMKTKLSFSFEELFTLWFHVFILLMHLSHFPEPSSLIPCPLPCGGGLPSSQQVCPLPPALGLNWAWVRGHLQQQEQPPVEDSFLWCAFWTLCKTVVAGGAWPDS